MSWTFRDSPTGQEQSYRGEHLIQPTGAMLDIPCADFWYVRDGKIKEFNCYVSVNSMLAQIGVLPDFASAVAAPAPAQ
jgi:ketosteroid isomerase-like protein